MKPYPKYKGSGIKWIGEIPSHWGVMPIKRIVDIPVTDGPHETPEFLDDGIPFISAEAIKNDKIDFSKKRGFISPEEHKRFSMKYCPKRGDIYMVKSGATTGNVAAVETDQVFNIWSPLAVVRPSSKKAITGHVFFWMKSRNFFQGVSLGWSYGTQQNIGMGVIENLSIPIPTIPEQQFIATYLDRKTKQLDGLIEKKQIQIDLLREQKTAVINEAVTKGLNPRAKMKYSGIEWIGDIPAHWCFKKIKYLFRLATDNAPDNNDHELLSLYTAIGVRPRKEMEERGNRATTTDGYWMVKKGDIIVNKLLAWMGAIGYSEYEGVTSPAYDILRKTCSLNSRFYHYLFRCGLYIPEFKRRSRGIMDMRLRLYFDELGQIPVAYPPEPEQNTIVEYLDHKTSEFDTMIAKEERLIELLQEYRTSLISEVVTGKVDVRNEK